MRVLYLSYTGLLEPLGQSQVLSYIEKLSLEHSITLISFEKKDSWNNKKKLEHFKKRCLALKIYWIPLKYHKKPRLLSTLYDSALFLKHARSVILANRVDLIHCRGYIPTFIGGLLKSIYKVPLIFDMRAFWPDEMVSANQLKKSSIVYYILKLLEKKCLENADYIITLTKAAEVYIVNRYNKNNLKDRIVTIPTCVNLEKFTLPIESSNRNKNVIVIGSVGTLNSWFKIDWFFTFFKRISENYPNANLRIISKSPKEFISSKLNEHNIDKHQVVIKDCEFKHVPGEIHQMNVGVFFFEPGFSKLGSAPTRMAEFLACGVPCIANSGVGDVQYIIEKYNVGIVIKECSDFELSQAVNCLIQLLEDPGISIRCRRAAEEWFSLGNGVEKYSLIYNELGKIALR